MTPKRLSRRGFLGLSASARPRGSLNASDFSIARFYQARGLPGSPPSIALRPGLPWGTATRVGTPELSGLVLPGSVGPGAPDESDGEGEAG